MDACQAIGVPWGRVGVRVEDRGGMKPLTEVSSRASRILEQAQALAEQLRRDTENENATLLRESAARRDESLTVLAEAKAERTRAAEIRRRASDHEAATRSDAHQLLKDVAGQAALLTARAEAEADDAVQLAHQQAATIVAEAHSVALQVRESVEREGDDVRQRLALVLAQTAEEAELRRVALEEQLLARRAGVEEEVEQHRQRAAQEVRRLRAEMDAESQSAVLQLASERRAAFATQQQEDEEALTARERLLEDAQIRADALIAEVSDQLEWSRDAVASLLSHAENERARQVRQTHSRLAHHTRRTHEQLRSVLARLRHEESVRITESRHLADSLQLRAESLLSAAMTDAERTRQQAETEADLLLETVRVRTADESQRVEHRLIEAEATGKVLQEQARTVFVEAQKRSLERARTSRDEAVKLLESARVDADAIRSEARAMLEDARHEVSVLARRRADITTQLGHMKGVIDALAVSGRDQYRDHSGVFDG